MVERLAIGLGNHGHGFPDKSIRHMAAGFPCEVKLTLYIWLICLLLLYLVSTLRSVETS
jgi:hypothetical protein